MDDKGALDSFGNLLLLYFFPLWDLVDPKFTKDKSSFTPLPPPLRTKLHHITVSLPLTITKKTQ